MKTQTEIAKNTLLNILKKLILRSTQYDINDNRLNTLCKAVNALESFPAVTLDGYIDISANTHLECGGLDYSSFTLDANKFEIYHGFVSYRGNEVDDSLWYLVFSSNNTEPSPNANEFLENWAESFLLHLQSNPKRSLLIIDKSKLINLAASKSEIPASAGMTKNND